jgi:O-antigen/teichoic acid export membrane protein
VNNKFLKNGFYNTVAGAIRIGLAILTIPLLIRLIGVEEYGLWTLASSVIAIVALAEAGLATATTVFVSQDLGKEDINGLSQTLTVTVGAMLILATLATITLWFGAEPIVNLFTKLDHPQQLTAVEALHIGGLVVWARLLQQVLVGVEQAYQRYGLMNLLNTMQSALLILGMFVVAWRGGRTVALMQWQAVASVAVLLSHAWVVQSLLQSVNLHFSWSKYKGLEIGRYSVMMWLSSLGGALFGRGDRLIVGSLLGTQSLGVYAAMTDIATQINSLSALTVQPLVPSLSNLAANRCMNQPKLQSQIKQALQINSFIALVIGGGLFTLANEILHLFITGIFYRQYIVAFCILIVIYSIYSVNGVGYYVLLALNSVNKCMVVQIISGILSLLLITIGSSKFGLVGAALGNSGYLLVWLLTVLSMRQLSIPFKRWIKWLQWSLLWFVLVIIINLILPTQLTIKMFILILQTIILTVWFIFSQKIKFISLV